MKKINVILLFILLILLFFIFKQEKKINKTKPIEKDRLGEPGLFEEIIIIEC